MLIGYVPDMRRKLAIAATIGADAVGHLTRGAQAEFVVLDDVREIRTVWQRGVCEYC